MNTYTDQQKAEALAALMENGGNVKATARELQIPRGTLLAWRDKQDSPAVINTISPELTQARIDLWDQTQQMAARRIQELLPLTTELRDVAVAARVAVDAYQDLAYGRKGQVDINGDGGPVQVNFSL